MHYLVLTMGLLLSCIESRAQPSRAFTFNSYNAVGFLAGKSPVAFTAQTVNGVQCHNWFAGAGFGIDDYFISSMPLFIDVKKEFAFKKMRGFLYGDVGTHFMTKDKTTSTPFSFTNTKGNLYLEGGAGLKIKTGQKSNVYFSVGNTMKKITQKETSLDTGFPYTYKTSYKLSRISFRMGYQF
jgi:hypothetical protein